MKEKEEKEEAAKSAQSQDNLFNKSTTKIASFLHKSDTLKEKNGEAIVTSHQLKKFYGLRDAKDQLIPVKKTSAEKKFNKLAEMFQTSFGLAPAADP